MSNSERPRSNETVPEKDKFEVFLSRALSVTCLAYFVVLIVPRDTQDALTRKFKRVWRRMKGPEPLSEDDLRELERRVVIEALRTVRGANEF